LPTKVTAPARRPLQAALAQVGKRFVRDGERIACPRIA
jgi:hypothetical protein